MKKHPLVFTLIAASLVGCAWHTPIGTEGVGPRCPSNAWSPEQYRFYGTQETIIEKLENIPAKFSERRVFLQVTQGDSGGEVKLYQRQKNGKFTVTLWTPKETSHLLAKIEATIMSNQGVNCVGEQIKGLLAKELEKGRVEKDIDVPASPQAVFGHSVKHASGKFIETAVTIFC